MSGGALRTTALACLLLAGSVAAATSGSQLAAARSGLSPVTRVVELLKGLSVQVEKEGKAEEDLYETFVCWAKSIISQKTKTNAEANSRIDTLETYIKDLDAGRIELTTERADLEKEIETLTGDIEVATELRDKEASDYDTARAEMQKAIDALTQAIEVLKTATDDHKKGVLMTLRSHLGESAESRSQEAARLSLAVSLGQKMLTTGDSVFLQRLLTGEVPKADWKKLNRKATFKMDYKARSFKIQGVLAKMLETFSSNLEDATNKEDDAKALFKKLKEAKGSELSAAQEALGKMEKENGARGLSKSEANEELDALKQQVKDDTKYIGQVQDSLDAKKKDWKARMVLRAGELAAISKAVGILYNDDSRDLFKKSFASQGLFFMQEGTSSKMLVRRQRAAETLRVAAARSDDRRVAALAARLEASAAGHFDEVVSAIDKMLTLLQGEEDKDLKIKETCEKDRAADTRDAIKASRTMDEHTEAINSLLAKIEELSKEIEDKEAQVEEIKKQLAEAKDNRDKEHAEYLAAEKDDKDAAALVKEAKETLENFYKENGLVFMQKKASAPFESTAGEAPPPPPPTWDGGYGGKTDEATGISAILGLVHEDILKDIEKAKNEEADALALYTKTKKALDDEKNDLGKEIIALTGTRGEAEGDVEDNKRDRSTKKGELEVVMQSIKDAEPGCAFFQINYPLRVANRQAEVDGLHKAKAILSGGEFAAPEDPSRELRPGDALLVQRPRLAAVRRIAV